MYDFYIPKKLIEQFKKTAKKAFPKEIISYLLGDIEHNVITVDELWQPDNVLKYCSHDSINIQPEWSLYAIEYAKDNDLSVIGSIHTHPFTKEELSLFSLSGKHQSEADIDGCGLAWQQISGICLVKESSSGRLSASVRFWGPTIPLNVRIE